MTNVETCESKKVMKECRVMKTTKGPFDVTFSIEQKRR